jgi:hypothetical protein
MAEKVRGTQAYNQSCDEKAFLYESQGVTMMVFEEGKTHRRCIRKSGRPIEE